ncbi:cyclopropane-fatty-acyl-phospholipid synthase [Agrocybe pediades]|nr:cyclopropane-fatty-acyl-phospholipid synthase [Agrocybe pediades]
MELPDARPPFSIYSVADRAWNRLAEAAFNTGWGPVAQLAETAVVSVMQNIRIGRLRVVTDSRVYTFPATEDVIQKHRLQAELRVRNNAFWVRLCTMGDLGFSEAYMYGDVECDDLVTLFEMFLANKEHLSNLNSRFSFLFSLPQKITSYRFLNTIGNSRSNISAHYDISNDMFAGFLSEDMTYSCAIFPELDGDLSNESDVQTRWDKRATTKRLQLTTQLPPSPPSSDQDDTRIATEAEAECLDINIPSELDDPLYEAQIRKLQHIINKLHIPDAAAHDGRPVRLLEIGTGWGALAIRVAQQYPHVEIDTITLSSAQKVLAEQRIASSGLQDRITVHLMDYRNIPPEWEGRFSRFVSVEMIEAVGREFLEGYWKVADWALDKKDAVGVVQVITIPEARFETYINEIDFIRKWVFPGGFLPTLTFLVQTLTSGSKGSLIIDSIENIGPHYARTLREWRRRFVSRFEEVIVPGLQKEYAARREQAGVGTGGMKVLSRDEIEVFRRKWIYYYCYCEVGFTTRTLGDHIMTFMREGYQDYGCDVYS